MSTPDRDAELRSIVGSAIVALESLVEDMTAVGDHAEPALVAEWRARAERTLEELLRARSALSEPLD